MKKTLLVLAAVIFLIPALTGAKEISVSNVTIDVPNDWKRNSDMEKDFSILSMYSKIGATVGLTKEPNKFNNSVDELKKYAIEALQKTAKNTEILDAAGENYFLANFESPSGYKMLITVYIYVQENDIYKLTFTAPSQKEFDSAKPEFEKIIKSFKIN